MAKPEVQGTHDRAEERGLVRLSLDLHDGPMQDLAAVGFSLDRLRRELGSMPHDTSTALQYVDGIREQLLAIELSLRSMIEGSTSLPRPTLASIVDDEVARFTQLDDATVELCVDTELEPETDSQLIALHRVLREALTNVHKHAQAARVQIDLHSSGDAIHLAVVDDGVGFDPAARERAGFGINGMHERIRLLGGELRVESRPGGPTKVVAAVHRWRPGYVSAPTTFL
jgi:signal transduction histidine kinase